MKTKSTLTAVALAFAALAAPLAARASTGDIVDIRVVDTDEMAFGDRSSLSPNRCTADNPLVTGNDLYIRVRMLVRNWPNVIGGTEDPETWYFANLLGSSLLYPPKLGIMIGERAAYAEYSEYGPKAWQKSGMLDNNDAGTPSSEWRFYTDFYFRYKVQPGDLGLPVKLMNSTGTGPASTTDDDTGYYILNCGPTSFWALQSTAGTEAKFSYGPEVLPVPASKAWPDGIPGDTALRNYDLSAEGAYVKTIDFDKINAAGDPYSPGDVWRDVYPGMSAAPGTVPTLIVGGGASAAATTVYIWSSDEAVVVPVASGANTVSTVDVGGETRQVLKVVVPEGVESVTFSMKGADSAAVGATATIYMSPAQGAVYKPSGELDDITVSRTVEVITAPEPTVTISVGGLSTDTVTADADYVTAKKQLVVKMTPACDYPVTVRLNAFVSGDDTLTSLENIYNANIIRIADGDYGGDPLDQKTIDVEIPATSSAVYKNVYILGGTAKTGNKGITFSTTKVSGPDNVTTKGSCTLRVNRSTPAIVDSDPAFSTETSPSTITVVSGTSVDFKLTIEDAYRELYDTATGYTFKWACDTEEIEDATGVIINDDGIFEASAEFNAITDGTELTLCVMNPDGKTSAKVKYNLVVTDAKKTTIAFQDPTKYVFPESDTIMENIVLGLSQPYNSGVSYIFLESDDPASFACVDSSLKTSGAQVDRGRTTTVMPFYQMRFLDGAANVTVKAVLYKNSDHSNRLTTYTAGTLSFAITNVPPQLMSVTAAGQYLTPDMAGQTVDPVSRGVLKSFTLVAEDVAADLPTVSARWVIDGTTYDTTMDPANPGQTLAVKHTFANAKDKAQVRVYLKDKDMAVYPATPNFMFYVPVTEKPGVTIETSAEGGIFMETDKSVSTISVKLSEPASDSITVRFTVSQAPDGGYLKIRTVAGSVEQALDGGGQPIPGAYDLTFENGVTLKTLVVSDMDGTNDTLSGLDLNAAVTTETTNPDGVKWCDFYTAAEPVLIRVRNVEPQIIRPTEAEEAYTNMNASANTPYAINYGCNDVAADLAAGITVDISIDGSPAFTDTLTDTTVKSFSAEFEGPGPHVVEFAFTDKDMMTSRRTINYYVQPNKTLELRAHGPAWAVGTSGGYSQHYELAAGLGAGRVYAGSSGPQKVENFVHTYSFGILEQSVTAYGFGYKADGSYDNGSLTPLPDKGIDKDGNWSKGQAIAAEDYYNYTTLHTCGLLGFDSFLYAWACNNTESSSTSGGQNGDTSMSLVFNMGESGETKIPMPDDTGSGSASSSSGTKDKTYPKQYWEAVFSREYLKADNCGDINLDGIPDVAVARYGMGIFDPVTGKLLASQDSASEGDLTDLKDFNKDLNKDGAEWPDFLPSEATSIYGSLIPGLSGTWVTDGRPFTARLEIRGYHDGLNDALAQLGFGKVKSDRVYAEEVDDGAGGTVWKWTENCTLRELEWYAWTEYAAAHGLDWKDKGAWQRWSPERPTNPMKSDTDGDGFDDGYEYYFWYKAHVGYMENGVHKRLTGRRYDPRNPGDGVLITSEEIELLMDPQVATDSAGALTRDTDYDGLPDLLEFEIGTNPFDFDTDGDGLPDGWELTLAGLNPLLAYTSADLIHDSARNYDGDAMAIASFKLEALEQPPSNHPEHLQYTTFAVIDPDGDTDGVQWYATKAEVAVETSTVQMWAFKLADGTAVVSLEKPLLTDDGRLAKTLARGVAFRASGDAPDIVRGWPVRLGAGTPVDATSVADAAVDVSVQTVAEAIEEKDANAAWIYGKGKADATGGEVAETAADYGCLALGRQLAVAKGAEIVAEPSDERDVALLHYLVYQQMGFDPRTAWSAEDPLADRWGKTLNDESVEGITIIRPGGYCAHPSHTHDYATYDEFLVYSFFLNNGCEMSGYYSTRYAGAPALTITWSMFTTNPQGPNEPDKLQLIPPADALGAVGWTQYFFGRDDADNGADTDGDGVPDGWELYVMSGPKLKGAFVFAPPYAGFVTGLSPKEEYKMPESYLSPFVDSAKKNDTNNQIYLGGQGNDDGLNEFQEFESTDAMNHYAEVYDGATTTVVHDGEWQWFNKFFPSNPWSVDTDGDGVSDSNEKKNFVYGEPADDGALRSIPGGGLNPNTVDTDGDGLPDGWEVQFKGKTPFPGKAENGTALPAELAEHGNKAKDSGGNEIGNYLQGLVDGMDGTVQDAYTTCPIDHQGGGWSWWIIDGVDQVVNRDYDHDGLENWQEYLTGTMRCWRYDDTLSPWIPIPKAAYFREGGLNPDFDLLKELFKVDIADMDDFWVKTLVDKTSPIYNPRLVTDMSSGAQYFSRVTNVWDAVYTDVGLGDQPPYYWFYNRVGDTMITKDYWPQGLSGDAPTKYPSCSPLRADSDGDGMDDYYELFHGMNPLLGASGFTGTGAGPCDLVCDAWGGLPMAWGDSPFTLNYWQMLPWKTPRGNGYDFEVFPWMNGVVDADPDGDDIRNQMESPMPNVNEPAQHSDPTPLWMTDTSYGYSLVNRFFCLPTRFDEIPVEDFGDTFTDGVNVYEFKDFDTWLPKVGTKPNRFGEFVPDKWDLTSPVAANWMFSFEENEGFDSDHDGLSDNEEPAGRYRGATDPLDADSPRRRQAMYFQGPDRPSALQTMPQVEEAFPVAAYLYPDEMAFAYFTVECWVRPESLEDSVIVERAICNGSANPGDEEFVRKNFQLAIRNGRWYAKYDTDGTEAGNFVEAVSATEADATKWTHLAATYDGSRLVLYVNAVPEATTRSSLLPAYGSSAIVLDNEDKYYMDNESAAKAIIIGASVKTRAEGGGGAVLDVSQGFGWDGYTRFYKGWIDEIRVWDGARTAAEVSETMNTRFTAELAAKNRSDFFDLWVEGVRRHDKGNTVAVPAELRYHWSFDSVFGADNEDAVAKSPHGFDDVRRLLSRPEDYEIPWLKKILDGYADTVYSAPDWVCWIPNTVAHLPRFDGTTLDSVYWSDDFAGDKYGTYSFARTAEPASRWTQMVRNGVFSAMYCTDGSRHMLVNTRFDLDATLLSRAFLFTGRHLNQQGDDLLALGGAYAKYCDDEVGLWDEQGASTNWEITGSDADGDGLPDWWEQYADENYRPEGMDPGEDIGWNTIVDYHGLMIKAVEAYLRDLARGTYLNEAGEIVVGPTKYTQVADGDGNGLPDWWEDLYGLTGESALSDFDNDGLPNYVEYLLSEVFRFEGIIFDPTNPRSVDNYTLDYFYRVGSLYVGEIFTDHDLVDDEWEDRFRTLSDGETLCASRYAYDPATDADGDGWSNFAENRAGTRPDKTGTLVLDDGAVPEYPIPLIRVRAGYAGACDVNASIVVKAYSKEGAAADATWTVAGSDSATTHEWLLGMNTGSELTLNLGPGAAVYGSVNVYFRDPNEFHVSEDGGGIFAYPLSTSWFLGMVDLPISGDSTHTRLGLGERFVFGDVDYDKGIATIRLADVPQYLYTSDEGTWNYVQPGPSNAYTRTDTSQSYIKVTWQDRRVADDRSWNFLLSKADSGHVREGVNTFVAFVDLNGNNEFDEGEPCGVATGVDVSWNSATVDIELTDESPIAPRFDVFAAGTMQVAVTNILTSSEGSSGGSSGQESSGIEEKPTRVRVVRWKIDDAPVCSMAVAPQVVLDKVMDPRVARTLSEADFTDEDTFDLDWDDFYSGVVQNDGVLFGNYKIVKADYLVFFGDGEVSWLNVKETNKWLTASAQVVTRYYGENRVLPAPTAPGSVSPAAAAEGVVNTASPTFAWTIDCPDREGYTAFRIIVSQGSATIYDSGMRRAPARDDSGVYRWTAPLYVGDMTPSGKVFANKARYSWRVAMYNSKYREDEWSASAAFYLNVQTNGFDCGSASVGVRYFGPEESYAGKTVRVQAFRTPGFVGNPAAAGYVADLSGIAKTGEAVAENCRIIGLPAGKYYLRAFIDSNNNGVCDSWETSGYLCTRDGSKSRWQTPRPVTIGPDVGNGDLAEIYMEDADTDSDGLPDAWEYAKYGRLTAKGVELLSETPAGEALVNKALSGDLELRENAHAPSAGLAGHVRSALSNAGTLALALGVNTAGYDSFAAAISGSVSEKLVEDGVKITSLDISGGKVVITVDAETEAGEALDSPLVSNVPAKSGGIEVVARVYWKQSLSDSQWTLVAEQAMVAGAGETTIDAGIAADGSSGFYKVEVSEK